MNAPLKGMAFKEPRDGLDIVTGNISSHSYVVNLYFVLLNAFISHIFTRWLSDERHSLSRPNKPKMWGV